MRVWLSLSLLSSLLLVALVSGAAAQSLPEAGLWTLSVTMAGAPSGGEARSGTACLAAQPLATAPEQTLFEAAGRQGEAKRVPPRCEFSELKRTARGADWKTGWASSCEGPMGKMQGTGEGVLGADAADLQQSFDIKAPIGSLTLKQTVRARRVGSC
jgi:hypothetical protein